MLDLPLHLLPKLAFLLPGHSEWIVLAIIGLLIFGRRLPEVGRNLGRSIVEFKRGIKGIGDEVEEEASKPATMRDLIEEEEGQGPPPQGGASSNQGAGPGS